MATAPKRNKLRSKRGSAERSAPASSSEGYDANDDDVKAMLPTGLSRVFVQSKLHEKELRQHGLAPVDDYEGELPELPEDIARVDHNDLSNLILAFQSALSTATWQASQCYIESDVFEEIAEYLENKALLETEQSNDSKRKAEAKTDERVVFFRGKSKIAYHKYVSYRDLARTIEGKIKVVSRVGGFKDDENAASDRNAGARRSGKPQSIRRGRGSE